MRDLRGRSDGELCFSLIDLLSESFFLRRLKVKGNRSKRKSQNATTLKRVKSESKCWKRHLPSRRKFFSSLKRGKKRSEKSLKSVMPSLPQQNLQKQITFEENERKEKKGKRSRFCWKTTYKKPKSKKKLLGSNIKNFF